MRRTEKDSEVCLKVGVGGGGWGRGGNWKESRMIWPERLLEARSSKIILAALQRVFVNKTEKKKEKRNRHYRLIIVAEAVQRAMLAGR